MRVHAVLYHQGALGTAGVRALEAREGLSSPFEVRVRVEVADPDVDLEAALWTSAHVEIRAVDTDEPLRHLDGVVEEARYLGPSAHHHARHGYELVLRPAVHALRYRVRSRIFQDLSVVAVVKQVLADAGVPTDTTVWDAQEGAPREYITQWKESELDFVCRLLEAEGIFFWFEHDAAGHVMVIADRDAVARPVDGASTYVVGHNDVAAQDPMVLFDVEIESRTTSDAVVLRDWNWETPDLVPQGAATADGLGFEIYEHPGGFEERTGGDYYAGIRLTEQLCRRGVLRGRGVDPRLMVGRWLSLSCERPVERSGDYVLLELVTEYAAHAERDPAHGGSYVCGFEAIPRGTVIRPARRTPTPRAHGKESAVITGPAGDEIHVDERGRVKVHFYWDREGAVDDTASCWIRVQQLNSQGSMMLPRVGWEVDVGFLYGDPDRPVVLQKLYNEETLPPYALPANLMQSALQSASSPGGGGTNEIRMNDDGGAQELFVHAQKDYDCMAGHDMTEEVAVDAMTQIGGTSGNAVGVDEIVDIGGNQSWSVTGGLVLDTAASKTVSVGGSDTWGIAAVYTSKADGSRTDTIGGLKNILSGKASETFNASHALTVGGVYSINAGGPIVEATAGNKTETVGGAKLELISGSKAENIGVGKLLTCGLCKVDAGATMSVTAKGAIAHTVGGTITIKAGGDVAISGSSVTMTVGRAKLTGGGSRVTANPGTVKIKASSVGASSANVKVSGTVKYK